MIEARRKGTAALAVTALVVGLIGAAIGVSTPVSAAAAAPAASRPGTYVAVAAARILDTRVGVGARAARVAAHGALSFAVTGRSGVPAASAVSAVVFNLTATRTADAGYISAYPTGAPAPATSSLNFVAGETRAHTVVVAPGTGGKVTLRNGSAGALDLVADVAGYYTAGAPTAGGEFAPVRPARVLDTRIGLGAPRAPMHHGIPLPVQLTGRGGIPVSGVSAVVLNVTVTRSTGWGYLGASSDGYSTGTSINFYTGQTVSNLVVVPLSSTGTMTLLSYLPGNALATVQAVADVSGYFRSGQPSGAGQLGSLNPTRLFDTRFGKVHALSPHSTVTVSIAGQRDIPATGVSAAVLNVAVVAPKGSGHVTAYPSGTTQPATSTVNFSGRTVSNLVVVPVGSDGKIRLYNGSATLINVVVDISGFVGRIPGPLTWSARTAFPTGIEAIAVSCASARFCAAVDLQGGVLFFDGTTWSTPHAVSPNSLAAVSCPVAGFCVALGDGSFVYSGGTWTHLGLPGSPQGLSRVSCRSSSFCVASDDTDEAHAWVFNGSVWTTTNTGIPQSDDGDGDDYGLVTVTCASTTFCLAAAADGPTARFNGTTWTVLSNVGGAVRASCPSPTHCVAVSDSSTLTFDGTSWSRPIPFPNPGDGVSALSCASSTFCVGVNLDGEMLSYNGTTWSSPVILNLDGLRDISCPTATFCLAIDFASAITGT